MIGLNLDLPPASFLHTSLRIIFTLFLTYTSAIKYIFYLGRTLKGGNGGFSELGLICLSTYLPPLNCDDVNSDNWPEIA